MHPWHPDCVLSSVNSTSVCYFCVLSSVNSTSVCYFCVLSSVNSTSVCYFCVLGSVNSTSVCYFSGYLVGMTGIWLNAKQVCIQNGSALERGSIDRARPSGGPALSVDQ